jgi:hypothetical protein
MKRLIVGLVSVLAFAMLVSTGQAQTDPQLGTWVLDPDSSTYSPGPAPRSQTVIYTQIGRGVRVTGQGLSADNKPVRTDFSYSFDGREHPARGFADWDSIKAEQVNARTIQYTRFLKGEEVQTVTRTISADGKTATVRVTGVDAKDRKVDNTQIYNKK